MTRQMGVRAIAREQNDGYRTRSGGTNEALDLHAAAAAAAVESIAIGNIRWTADVRTKRYRHYQPSIDSGSVIMAT